MPIIEAFEDSWHWNDSAETAFDEVMRSGNTAAFELLRSMRALLGDNDMMAYLAMMTVHLLELHRVLSRGDRPSVCGFGRLLTTK